MEAKKIIQLIKNRYRKPGCLYHFTDTRNIPSIVKHGILSASERAKVNILDNVSGGNDWSHDQDIRKGLTDYVHLCFFDTHPMEYHARSEGRLNETYFIKVLPDIIDREGVKFCAGVSNAADSIIFGLDEFENHMDMKALFRYMKWRDSEELARVKITEKYEILIPKRIPKSYLRK